MMNYVQTIFFIFITLFSSVSYTQKSTFSSRSELGLFAGGSYYLGDLNREEHITNSKLALGLVYKYNVHTRLALRGSFYYGNVYAYDAINKNENISNRNLHFKSNVFELAVGPEFSHYPFLFNNPKYAASGYLFIQLAYFRMNPQAKYNDEWYNLREFATEGQGTELNENKVYKLNQLSIPVGMGFKLSFLEKFSIGVEYGIRKTFTDYLDDVGASRFVDKESLEMFAGPIAAELSNRSIDESIQVVRGNPNTKDWYIFYGVTLSARLGTELKCPTKGL